MNFFKKKSYDIVRMLITQIGISVFALIMSTTFSFTGVKNDSIWYVLGNVAISAFSIIFYYILLYTSAWDWGAKDKIRIDAGKLTKNNAKVLLMSLIANIPNLAVASFSLFCLIFSVCGLKFFFYAAGTLSYLVIYLSSHMFVGTTAGIFGFLKDTTPGADNSLYFLMQMILFILLFTVTILVCHLGYSLGIREKRIFGFIKTKPKKYE